MLHDVKAFRLRGRASPATVETDARGLAGAGRRGAGCPEALDREQARRAQRLSSIQGEIRGWRRPRQARQASLPAQARARLAAQQRAAGVSLPQAPPSTRGDQTEDSLGHSAGRPLPSVAVRRRRRGRDAVPREPVRLGRREPRAASTAPGLVDVRLRAGRRLAAAHAATQYGTAASPSRATSSSPATSSSSTASATSASTSAAASSSTRRTPATS